MSQSIINCVLKQFTPEELASNKELQSAIEELKTLQGVDARSRAIELANDYNLSIEKQINQAANLSEINTRWSGLVDDIIADKVATKEGLERLRKFAAEGVHHYGESLSGEIVAPLQSVINKMQPEGLLRVFGSKMGEYDILSAFYGKGGKSLEGQAVADALNNWLSKTHQVLVDSGLRSPSEKFSSFIPVSISDRKLVKMDVDGFKRLVTELVDQEHFNFATRDMVRKLGGIDQYFEAVKDAYTIGRMGAEGKVGHFDLIDSFENGLKAASPEAWLELNEGLGRSPLVVTLLEQSERMGKQAARHMLLGSEDNITKTINKSVTDLFKAGKITRSEMAGLKKNLETTAMHHFGKWSISAEGFNKVAKWSMYTLSGLQDVGAASRLPNVIVDVVVGDKSTSLIASTAAGLGTNLKSVAKSMPGVPYKDAQDQMISAGLGLLTMRDRLSTVVRYADSMSGPVSTKKMAATVFNLSGINRLTNKNRAVSIEHALSEIGFFAKSTPWEKLDDKFLTFLKGHNIGKAEWAHIADNVRTNKLLDLTEMLQSSDRSVREAARKLNAAGYNFLEMAVPTSNFRFQAYKARIGSSGPAMKLITESITSMMSWSASFVQSTVINPIRAQGWRAVPRIATIWGAYVVLQSFTNDLKDWLHGRNLMPLSEPNRWRRAFAQATPFIGNTLWELISGDKSYGGGQSAGGLPAKIAADAVSAAFKFGRGLFDPEKDGTYAVIKTFFDNMPKTGYTALLTRAMQDQIMLMLAPDAYDKLMRDNARQAKLGGYWWQRGSTTPNAPSFSHMFQ